MEVMDGTCEDRDGADSWYLSQILVFLNKPQMTGLKAMGLWETVEHQ